MSVMRWPIVTNSSQTQMPSAILTHAPHRVNSKIPIEAALHLPTGSNNDEVLAALHRSTEQIPRPDHHLAAGFLLSDYFLHVTRAVNILTHAQVNWVANFPSVGQQGAEFCRFLSEVDMGVEKEITALQAFKDEGFNIIASLSDTTHIKRWVALNPDMIVCMPLISNLKSENPLDAQTHFNSIRTALAYEGWQGNLLPYVPNPPPEQTACISPPRHHNPHDPLSPEAQSWTI